MNLFVGCPVRDRAWIIERWFEHLAASLKTVEIPHSDVTCVFVGDYYQDDTFRQIDKTCLEMSFNRIVVEEPEPNVPYERRWGKERYQRMADLRNLLLGEVRKHNPDVFWSLDSDILVSDDALISGLDAIMKCDAVATKCFLSPLRKLHPNYCDISPTGNLLRSDSEGLLKVQVIMASKIMRPKAYNVDYKMDPRGEDIGWSLNAKEAGCVLGFDGRTCSKHVMNKEDLDKIDERCGF